MAQLSSILTWSSSAICHLVCLQCSMLLLYLKCVSRFFQYIRIWNKEFVSNFALQMEFRVRYRWKCYSAFKSGRDEVEDLPRSVRPTTSSTEVNIAKVKEMVTENRHLSLRVITAELSVYYELIRTILNDCLGMKRVAARLVPKDHLTRLSLWTNFWPKTKRISPDIAPADFFLFPKLKLPLRGTRFQSIEDIKENSRRELKSILENAFKNCFDDWIIRWHECIISQIYKYLHKFSSI